MYVRSNSETKRGRWTVSAALHPKIHENWGEAARARGNVNGRQWRNKGNRERAQDRKRMRRRMSWKTRAEGNALLKRNRDGRRKRGEATNKVEKRIPMSATEARWRAGWREGDRAKFGNCRAIEKGGDRNGRGETRRKRIAMRERTRIPLFLLGDKQWTVVS